MGKNLKFLVILWVGLFFVQACQKAAEKPKFDAEKVRKFANALYNRQLYHQAIDEYKYYLNNYRMDEDQAANINYIIANIYFERVHDYENALAYYLKIKHLYPDSPLLDEANKRIVECLERLERSADAQQAMEEAALLDPSQAHPKRPGAVIAKIGKREITMGDLEYEINQLPPYMREQMNDRNKKIEFLKQYIATELLYDTAKRKGLDKDKEVIAAAFQAKKNIMVQKLLEDEISQNVNIRESDVELYYKAHKEEYAKKDDNGKVIEYLPFDQVKDQVLKDLIKERQKEAYEQLVQRMMRAEAVEIYEDKIQ